MNWIEVLCIVCFSIGINADININLPDTLIIPISPAPTNAPLQPGAILRSEDTVTITDMPTALIVY